MQARIEESCICGAKLVYCETVDEAYELNVHKRQKAFHEAHAACRTIKPAASPQHEDKRKDGGNVNSDK